MTAMTFLQPILLAGLPLVSLPIIIHLINQRRYQTIRWAAMISHCRTRAYPRDIRFAASRNIIAPQRTVWYRRWLIR